MTDLAPGRFDEAEYVDMETFLGTPCTEFSEYVHVVFDQSGHRAALYRQVGETGSDDVLRTDIRASIRFRQCEREPYKLYLTAGNAETLLTFLDRMRVERSPLELTIEYMETNNSQMIDESDMDQETVVFEYETDSGRSNRIEIDSLYNCDTHMVGKFR